MSTNISTTSYKHNGNNPMRTFAHTNTNKFMRLSRVCKQDCIDCCHKSHVAIKTINKHFRRVWTTKSNIVRYYKVRERICISIYNYIYHLVRRKQKWKRYRPFRLKNKWQRKNREMLIAVNKQKQVIDKKENWSADLWWIRITLHNGIWTESELNKKRAQNRKKSSNYLNESVLEEMKKESNILPQ